MRRCSHAERMASLRAKDRYRNVLHASLPTERGRRKVLMAEQFRREERERIAKQAEYERMMDEERRRREKRREESKLILAQFNSLFSWLKEQEQIATVRREKEIKRRREEALAKLLSDKAREKRLTEAALLRDQTSSLIFWLWIMERERQIQKHSLNSDKHEAEEAIFAPSPEELRKAEQKLLLSETNRLVSWLTEQEKNLKKERLARLQTRDLMQWFRLMEQGKLVEQQRLERKRHQTEEDKAARLAEEARLSEEEGKAEEYSLFLYFLEEVMEKHRLQKEKSKAEKALLSGHTANIISWLLELERKELGEKERRRRVEAKAAALAKKTRFCEEKQHRQISVLEERITERRRLLAEKHEAEQTLLKNQTTSIVCWLTEQEQAAEKKHTENKVRIDAEENAKAKSVIDSNLETLRQKETAVHDSEQSRNMLRHTDQETFTKVHRTYGYLDQETSKADEMHPPRERDPSSNWLLQQEEVAHKDTTGLSDWLQENRLFGEDEDVDEDIDLVGELYCDAELLKVDYSSSSRPNQGAAIDENSSKSAGDNQETSKADEMHPFKERDPAFNRLLQQQEVAHKDRTGLSNLLQRNSLFGEDEDLEEDMSSVGELSCDMELLNVDFFSSLRPNQSAAIKENANKTAEDNYLSQSPCGTSSYDSTIDAPRTAAFASQLKGCCERIKESNAMQVVCTSRLEESMKTSVGEVLAVATREASPTHSAHGLKLCPSAKTNDVESTLTAYPQVLVEGNEEDILHVVAPQATSMSSDRATTSRLLTTVYDPVAAEATSEPQLDCQVKESAQRMVAVEPPKPLPATSARASNMRPSDSTVCSDGSSIDAIRTDTFATQLKGCPKTRKDSTATHFVCTSQLEEPMKTSVDEFVSVTTHESSPTHSAHAMNLRPSAKTDNVESSHTANPKVLVEENAEDIVEFVAPQASSMSSDCATITRHTTTDPVAAEATAEPQLNCRIKKSAQRMVAGDASIQLPAISARAVIMRSSDSTIYTEDVCFPSQEKPEQSSAPRNESKASPEKQSVTIVDATESICRTQSKDYNKREAQDLEVAASQTSSLAVARVANPESSINVDANETAGSLQKDPTKKRTQNTVAVATSQALPMTPARDTNRRFLTGGHMQNGTTPDTSKPVTPHELTLPLLFTPTKAQVRGQEIATPTTVSTTYSGLDSSVSFASSQEEENVVSLTRIAQRHSVRLNVMPLVVANGTHRFKDRATKQRRKSSAVTSVCITQASPQFKVEIGELSIHTPPAVAVCSSSEVSGSALSSEHDGQHIANNGLEIDDRNCYTYAEKVAVKGIQYLRMALALWGVWLGFDSESCSFAVLVTFTLAATTGIEFLFLANTHGNSNNRVFGSLFQKLFLANNLVTAVVMAAFLVSVSSSTAHAAVTLAVVLSSMIQHAALGFVAATNENFDHSFSSIHAWSLVLIGITVVCIIITRWGGDFKSNSLEALCASYNFNGNVIR